MTQITANPSQFPRTTHMTFLLIALNVVVFVFLQTQGGPSYENLLLFGAKENGLIAEGQLARLFFPMFLHANALHIGMNMWGLYQVGRYLEFLIGPRKLIALYLLAGITGNMASFALTTPLSVGASGALFGFLSCLWVLQKYEEKLASEMQEPVQKSTIGFLLAVNVIIGFIIPNLDWASHLGGCLVGVFFGLALVARHKWNMRVLGAIRYLGGATGLGKPPWKERESLYFSLIAALNIALAFGYFKVGPTERAFGLGTLAAAQNRSGPKNHESIAQYRVLIEAPKSEVNPDRLLALALAMHRENQYASVALVYDVLVDFARLKLGRPEFHSQTTHALLADLRQLAREGKPPSEEVVKLLGELPAEILTSSLDPLKMCEDGGKLFHALGFFDWAGQLFECSYYLDIRREDVAARVYESYWLSNPEDKRQVERFRLIQRTLLPAPISLAKVRLLGE
jgi:rhomboid protease GluP